jgi:hypothetical protein
MRVCVFIFDLIRFALITSLFIGSQKIGLSSEYVFFFPVSLLLTPTALFPIMMFFLMIDPLKYKSYASLYCAGKIISICAVVAAFVKALYVMLPSLIFWTPNKFILNFSIPFIALMDIASVFILLPKITFKKKPPEPNTEL